MDFEISEEQQLLTEAVQRFVKSDYAFEARRRIVASHEGWSSDVWEAIAEMGLLSIPLSPDHGGFGGGAVELMPVMEAFGEALLVEPFLPTLLGARCVAGAGSAAQQAALLPQLAEGKLRMAFALSERGARYDLAPAAVTATPASDGGWALNGAKLVVIGAPAAERIAVTAKAPRGPSLFLVDARSVSMQCYRTLDEMRAADLTLSGTPAELLGAEGEAMPAIEEVADFATALLCAEAVGAMKFCCETTLDYLKTRRQFGVPIGSFQALQHRVVDMFIAAEQARSMACLACSKIDGAQDGAERARAVSGAKVEIAADARLVSQEAIQLHGGIGMSEELKVSHAFRRLTMIAQQFGDADHHLERYAALG